MLLTVLSLLTERVLAPETRGVIGLRKPWLFFVTTLFTSCAFGLCLYLYVAERTRRHDAWREEAGPVVLGGPQRT